MKITQANIKQWQQNSADAFFQWLADVKPRILTRAGRYEVFKPTKGQKAIIENVLSSHKNRFTRTISLQIMPRRHSKSTIFALTVLFLFTSRKNHTTMLLGNSELHARRVQFNLLARIIKNTPILNAAIPEQNVQQYAIHFKALANTIQIAPTNLSVSFGDQANVLWVSDLHAAIDLSPFNALQASLLDSEDSLCFIDTNVDFQDGHVHGLQIEAETDESMYCKYVSYKDFDDFAANAPPWIDRAKAKRLKRTTLPVDFARDILGKRSDAKNSLFTSEIIERCKDTYKIPVLDPKELAGSRKYKTAGALDRARSLFQTRHSDATVFTSVLKLTSPQHGEPEFFILNQKKINPNTSKAIKKVIQKDNERYSFDQVALENHETGDLAPWLADQKIPFELVTPHDTNQNASFPELFRIANEARLHIPANAQDLVTEMRTFTYSQKPGSNYSFGHSAQRFHDDHVYSLNWSIFALRAAILSAYVLGNFQCHNRTQNRHFCFLMGGSLELACRHQCYAYERVHTMKQEYNEYQLDSDMSIQDFFYAHVKANGARVSQAV